VHDGIGGGAIAQINIEMIRLDLFTDEFGDRAIFFG
jgi:hypothetical protein